MAKKSGRRNRHSMANRALNAFRISDDDEPVMRGTSRADQPEPADDDDEKPDYTSGVVNPEDDEEIDSDEALGSDDELGLLPKGKDDPEIDLDEDQDYTDIDESELVPLSEAWDMDEASDGELKHDSKHSTLKLQDVDSDDSGSEEDDESSDADESDSSLNLSDDDEEDEEIDEEKMAKLRSMISGMDEDENKRGPKKLKKQRLQVLNVAEGEFALPTGGQKLSLADLTSGVSSTPGLKLLPDPVSAKSGEPETLSIPLPKRIQERHDRRAAYELAKEEVSKWESTVKTNREAEHLQFPINPAAPVIKTASFTPVQPSTALEKKVSEVLTATGLAEEKSLSTFEELAPSKLSMEEVKRRRNELRLMRELMFREEAKAKRIKKIKSKSYRKVHKKQREREQALVEGEEEEDKDDHDINRARERMTLKHKNTGKWAKRMVEQGFTKDSETRAEMEEMLRRGEDLRMRILDDGEEEEPNVFSEGESGDDEDNERVSQKESLGKGVLAMKFMRDAEQREKRVNRENLDALRNAEADDVFAELDEESADRANEVLNAGRRKFTPGTVSAHDDALDALQEARDEHDIDQSKSLSNTISKTFVKKTKAKVVEEAQEETDENPWLSAGPKKATKASQSVAVLGGNSSSQQKAQAKVKKQRGTSSKSDVDRDADIDMNQLLEIVDPLASDSEADSDAEKEASMVRKPKKGISFKQQELVKRAFAGDDVVAEFQQEKRQKIEEEGDKEIDVTLPGWGSWSGTSTKPKKKYVKKIEGIKADQRKDAKLKSVIISEKVNKKHDKYAASGVPFPFENREQYERSLRMPVGKEWASTATFQRLTMPKVVVKQGTVIDPIKAPFK